MSFFRNPTWLGSLQGASAAAPVPPVDPTSDPNLWGWYSVDTGFANNGVQMSGPWTDRSGLGHDFLTPGAGLEPLYQPTGCGSKPYAQWTGSQFIRTNFLGPSYVVAQPIAYYLLIRMASWQDSKVIIDSATSTNMFLQMYPSVPGNISMYGGSAYAPTNTGFAFGSTWQIITAIFNGASSTLSINNSPDVTGNPGSSGINGIMLGWYHGGGPYFSTFDLGALIISTAADTPAIRTIHKNWMANYAGITI